MLFLRFSFPHSFILSFIFFILSFFRNILKHFLQECPEGLDGGDECTLGSGVGRLHRRSEAHYVEVRILAQDDGTLQSCMVYLDDAVLTEEVLVLLQQQM